MTIPFASSLHRIMGVAVLLALSGITHAAGLSSQEAVSNAGLDLVETATKGHVDEAFASAKAMLSPSDAVMVDTLDARQKIVSQQTVTLGAASGPARLVSSRFFGGCVHAEYLARYAGGTQRWLLNFRQTSRGWTLSDLDVVNERAS